MVTKILAAGATCLNRIFKSADRWQSNVPLPDSTTAAVSNLRECAVSARDEFTDGQLLTARRIAVSITRLLLLSVFAVDPALAQNPVCQEESETLINMIEGFVQLTTGLGIMGLLVVWQADSLMEIFTLSKQRQESIKQHKQRALKSATILVLLGPLFTVMGSTMDLPIADCVDLIPL